MNNADKLEEEHICARRHACTPATHRPICILRYCRPRPARGSQCAASPVRAMQQRYLPSRGGTAGLQQKKKKALSVCRLVAVRSRGDQLISPVSSPVPLLLQHSLPHASASHKGFTYNLTCHHLCTCVCLITPPCLSLHSIFRLCK